jgi:uncharacterized membrane protein
MDVLERELAERDIKTGAPKPAASGPEAMLAKIRADTRLDGVATRVQRLAEQLRLPELSRRGEEVLGHTVHPALTDLPIGFWTSSFVLDLVGGGRAARASRMLVGAGVLSAVPTVAFGMGDAAKLEPEPRRIAAVHAVANLAATAVYAASWRKRRHSHRGAGIALGLLAGALASAGGYLGGALAWASADDDD